MAGHPNTPEGGEAFRQAWDVTDKIVADGGQRTWLWGPQPFNSVLIEGYQGETDNARLVQYYDKGRMERRSNGKGGFLVTVGRLGWELLTGKVDLGGGLTADRGPAQIPMAGDARDATAPTYADAAVGAAHPTLDRRGLPVDWKLERGGKTIPFTPPADVRLTTYDPETGHNVADVFARWYDQALSEQIGESADGRLSLGMALREKVEGLDPGHPLTDPFWVEVIIDHTPRAILVQVFQRWVLTYTPDNPEGWQIELGNVGLHYYDWRYETEAREALLNTPGADQHRRRAKHRGRFSV